jgi:hypothetical protein
LKIDISEMIIEFIGLPGTGKTTYSNELANRLKKRGIDVKCYKDVVMIDKSSNIWFLKYIYKYLIFMVLNFQMFIPIIYLCIKKPKFLTKYRRLIFLFKLIYFVKYSENKQRNLILMDQGLVQYLWSLFWYENNIDEKFVEKFIKRFRYNYKIILIGTNKNLLFQRIKSRNDPNDLLKSFDDIELKRILNSNNQYFDSLVPSICKKLKIPLIKLINIDNNEVMTNKMLDFIYN